MKSQSVAVRARCFRAAGVLGSALVAAGLTTAAAAPASAVGHRMAAAARHVQHPYLTPGQASVLAARTGKAVPVTGATTATSTLNANPDGTFTLTESGTPVRAKVGGTWRDLDATLIRHANGTYSPAVSSQPLTLSGGGTGPLASMSYGGYSLALSAPMTLPAPSVTGNTATYRGVLPGVDLIVTADTSGGFRQVFRIASAAAAANPALKMLTFTARTSGLTLRTGRNGAIAATSRNGQVIFAAPAPAMWDSAVLPGLKTVMSGGGIQMDRATAQPAASTAAGPGDGARTGRVAVTLHENRLTLTPGHVALAGTRTIYPEYIDPSWDSAGSSATTWAYVSSDFPGQQYFDTSSYLQMGHNPDTGGTSYSFYSMAVPSQIRGAYINDAVIYLPEVWSYSCTASPVDAYLTGAISSATTYNNQPSWGSKLGSDNVAYGWSSAGYIGGPSSCPANGQDVSYDIRSTIAADAAIPAGQPWPGLTVGLKAEDTTDSYGWKQFSDPRDPAGTTATMTITYAFQPAKPVLSTSPAADCATGTSVLGNGNVVLDTAVYDKDGTKTGNLTVTYTAYAAGNTGHTFATNPSMTASAASGTTAALQLKAADLQHADSTWGSGGQVSITWTATVSDGLGGVPTSSASCSFIFSTAIPGAPDITDSAGNPCDTQSLSYSVGTQATFTLSASTTTRPTSYTYQLNGGVPLTKAAGASSPYSAAIQITPTRQTNVLTVDATAAGGNLGQASSCVINAAAPAPATDQDMTGDGIPDLVTVGNGTTGTAAGLWLADGQGSDGAGSSGRSDGTVATTATDIAPYGPQGLGTGGGTANPGTPASWNGMRAITGQFLGPGFNDIEAYAPATGDVYILPGQGDGSATSSQDQDFTNVFDDTSQVSQDTNLPLQLASAYNVSGDNEPYPDQIGLFSDPSTAVGAYLGYFANSGGDNSFDAGNALGLPFELTNATPDGTMDWADWTITTDSDTRGGTAYTDMWLWNQATGALYLWELTGLANQTPGGFSFVTFTYTNPTANLTYTQTQLSAGFDTSTSLATFQATDINGEPGLVTVTSTGQVQSFDWNGTTLTQANANTPAQALLTCDHAYLLDDAATGTVATAADQPGAGDTAENLTGNSGTTWTAAGALFDPLPDVKFNGTSGYLTAAGADFTPNSSFTISAWVNPSALGGTVFSQDGSQYSTVKVSSTTNGWWSVAMNTGGSSYATGIGGTARAGVWTNLTLTYDTTNGSDILNLYVDGVQIISMADTTPPSATGKFMLGADQAAGAAGSFLTGQLTDVRIWDDLATPPQPATPASAFVPVTPVRIMDTRSAYKIGPVTGPVGAGATVVLPIDGNTTASLPATGITAVSIALTVTGQTAAGYLAVYPDGTPQPITSNLNFSATGGNRTNNAIVAVGPGGDIAIVNASSGTDQVIVDLTGYFTTSTNASNASTFTPQPDPTRILDTRNGTGATKAQIAGGGTLTMTIAGNNTNGAGVPASGVTAVALNLTAVAPSGDSGFLEAYPDGATTPAVSLLTYNGGAQAGTIIIPVGGDGKIDIRNSSATAADLVGDLSGYFTTSASGQYYHPIDNTRIIDTRQATALGAGASTTIADPAGITADNPSLILNLTAAEGASNGDLQAWPSSAATPLASILNYPANTNIANLALVNTATANSFTIKNQSAGSVEFIIDVNGYFQ